MFRSVRTLIVMLALMGALQKAAVAQNGHTGTNVSNAVLTIQVQVAPTVMSPSPAASESSQSVSYAISVVPVRLSVIEKQQLEEFSDGTGKVQRRLVRIVTVVPE
jgi:hypothetical protein